MCGVSGYVGLDWVPEGQKDALVVGLAFGIDARGGHASGFSGTYGQGVGSITRCHRKLGPWMKAKPRFFKAASKASTLMMHARWATHGAKEDIRNAHPFPVQRNGQTVLYGAHNGVLSGTTGTAQKWNRRHSVDSLEFFELLADKAYRDIQTDLGGYGVVTWMVPGDSKVRVCRVSSSSDFELAKLKGGGYVWASTKAILKDAVKFAKLEVQHYPKMKEVGQVYIISADTVVRGKVQDLKVSAGHKAYDWRSFGSYGGGDYSDEGWDDASRYRIGSGMNQTGLREPQRQYQSRWWDDPKTAGTIHMGDTYYKRNDDGVLQRYNPQTGEFLENSVTNVVKNSPYSYNPKDSEPKEKEHSYLTGTSSGLDSYDEEEKKEWERFWQDELNAAKKVAM